MVDDSDDANLISFPQLEFSSLVLRVQNFGNVREQWRWSFGGTLSAAPRLADFFFGVGGSIIPAADPCMDINPPQKYAGAGGCGRQCYSRSGADRFFRSNRWLSSGIFK